MIVFHNDVVNVILNTWSFLLEKETNTWKPQLEPKMHSPLHPAFLQTLWFSFQFHINIWKDVYTIQTLSGHYCTVEVTGASLSLSAWLSWTDRLAGGRWGKAQRSSACYWHRTKSAWPEHEASQELSGIQAAPQRRQFFLGDWVLTS